MQRVVAFSAGLKTATTHLSSTITYVHYYFSVKMTFSEHPAVKVMLLTRTQTWQLNPGGQDRD